MIYAVWSEMFHYFTAVAPAEAKAAAKRPLGKNEAPSREWMYLNHKII